MTETIHQLEVLRYDPETDTAPHFQIYEVSCQEDWVVLDAINYVKENLDRTLSYRWSCHMAVCGSCGMVVNGEPVLSCHAFVRDYPEKIRARRRPTPRRIFRSTRFPVRKTGSCSTPLITSRKTLIAR